MEIIVADDDALELEQALDAVLEFDGFLSNQDFSSEMRAGIEEIREKLDSDPALSTVSLRFNTVKLTLCRTLFETESYYRSVSSQEDASGGGASTECILFLDYKWNEIGGGRQDCLSLLEQIKSKSKSKMAVVVFSSYVAEDMANKAYTLNANLVADKMMINPENPAEEMYSLVPILKSLSRKFKLPTYGM